MTAERTAKAIVAGTWGCAGIVMAGSATNAFLAYGALGDNRALGLATGLAVDIGLCVALIGDRRLYAHGLSSNWGRALRITTAVMSLILNTGIALRDGHYFMALLHSFLPVLLVVLTEYGQDVLLKFTALRQAVDQPTDGTGSVVSHQPTEPVLTIPAARHEPVVGATPEPVAVRQIVATAPAVVATKPATATPATVRQNLPTNLAVVAATETPSRDKPRDKPATRRPRQDKPATPEQRRAWVRHERDNGRTVTGADVHKQFPNSPRDGARIVRQVEADIDAELVAVATGGGR